MREILFRGKRKDNGEWVYGDFLKSYCVYVGYEASSAIYDGKRFYEVIPETVSQFTGLTDCDIDGILVFDGDIIENCDTKDLQIVFWNEDKAAWYCRYVIDEFRFVSLADSIGNLNKVIGNIHDNPELLK